MFCEMLSDCVFYMILNTLYTKQRGIILIAP